MWSSCCWGVVISLRHQPTRTPCWLQQTGLKFCTVSAASWSHRSDDSVRGEARPSPGLPGWGAPMHRSLPSGRLRSLLPRSSALETPGGPSLRQRSASSWPQDLWQYFLFWCWLCQSKSTKPSGLSHHVSTLTFLTFIKSVYLCWARQNVYYFSINPKRWSQKERKWDFPQYVKTSCLDDSVLATVMSKPLQTRACELRSKKNVSTDGLPRKCPVTEQLFADIWVKFYVEFWRITFDYPLVDTHRYFTLLLTRCIRNDVITPTLNR